jgi:hypothetical protein
MSAGNNRLGQTTYTANQHRESGRDRKREEQRYDNRRASGIRPEDVADLLEFAISERLFVFWRWGIGIKRDFYIEDIASRTLRRAE